MNQEHEHTFARVAELLGAVPQERETNDMVAHYQFGPGELEFYFIVDWRNESKGRISATTPKAWGHGHACYDPPSIGFSLSRTPEALARDIRRRWLDDANAWHWKRVEKKNVADNRRIEFQLQVEGLLRANGCNLSHDEAKFSHRDDYQGHGIHFSHGDIMLSGFKGHLPHPGRSEARSGVAHDRQDRRRRPPDVAGSNQEDQEPAEAPAKWIDQDILTLVRLHGELPTAAPILPILPLKSCAPLVTVTTSTRRIWRWFKSPSIAAPTRD